MLASAHRICSSGRMATLPPLRPPPAIAARALRGDVPSSPVRLPAALHPRLAQRIAAAPPSQQLGLLWRFGAVRGGSGLPEALPASDAPAPSSIHPRSGGRTSRALPIRLDLATFPPLDTMEGTSAVLAALARNLRRGNTIDVRQLLRASGMLNGSTPLQCQDGSTQALRAVLDRHRTHLQAGGLPVGTSTAVHSLAFLRLVLEPFRCRKRPHIYRTVFECDAAVAPRHWRTADVARSLLQRVTDPRYWHRTRAAHAAFRTRRGRLIPLATVLQTCWEDVRPTLLRKGFTPEELPRHLAGDMGCTKNRHYQLAYFAIHGQPALPRTTRPTTQYPLPMDRLPAGGAQDPLQRVEQLAALLVAMQRVDLQLAADGWAGKQRRSGPHFFWSRCGEVVTDTETMRRFLRAVLVAQKAGHFPEAPMTAGDWIPGRYPIEAFRAWVDGYLRAWKAERPVNVGDGPGKVLRRRGANGDALIAPSRQPTAAAELLAELHALPRRPPRLRQGEPSEATSRLHAFRLIADRLHGAARARPEQVKWVRVCGGSPEARCLYGDIWRTLGGFHIVTLREGGYQVSHNGETRALETLQLLPPRGRTLYLDHRENFDPLNIADGFTIWVLPRAILQQLSTMPSPAPIDILLPV